MKPRTATHSGQGSAKHNFREFPEEAKGYSDIDRGLSLQNKFLLNGKFFNSQSEMQQYLKQNISAFSKQKEQFKDDKQYKDLSLSQKFELMYYTKYFGETIKAQHQRNERNRQQCLNKSAIDMLLSKKTQPEESILQIGNKDYCPISGDELWSIYKDYQKKHNAKFGRYIKILDSVLHVDESTIHIHERKIYIGVNSHGEAYPGKDSALGLLGIERPDMSSAKGRYNNRKQTYSAQCRKLWIETCQEHGLDIETIPREYAGKKGLTTIEYKVSQEQKKLQSVKEQIDKKTSSLISIDSKVSQKRKEYNSLIDGITIQREAIQKNDSMLRSQVSTIQSNDKILKRQTQLKQSLKNDVDDLNNQEAELNQRMEILYSEYSEDYEKIDIVDYISQRLKKEYPDYFKELLADFRSQSYVHEYDSIER